MPAAARPKLYSSVYDNFVCPYEKSVETYRIHRVFLFQNLISVLEKD